jgi:hypothetical protein
MLRIRDMKGQVSEITEPYRFVELCDATGKVAKLFFIDDSGMLRVVDARDKDAAEYSKLFKVQFCPVIQLPA